MQTVITPWSCHEGVLPVAVRHSTVLTTTQCSGSRKRIGWQPPTVITFRIWWDHALPGSPSPMSKHGGEWGGQGKTVRILRPGHFYPSRTSKKQSLLDSFPQVSKRWPDLLIFMSWGLPPWPILLFSSSIFHICYCSAAFCTPNYIWASAPSKIQVTHICLQIYIWAPVNLD